mgnify:CR=1 FL=1
MSLILRDLDHEFVTNRSTQQNIRNERSNLDQSVHHLQLIQWVSYVLERKRYVNTQTFIIFRRRDLLKGIGHNITIIPVHTHL